MSNTFADGLLDDPHHDRVLKIALHNLDEDLAGCTTDDPKYAPDGYYLTLPSLYCVFLGRILAVLHLTFAEVLHMSVSL